MTYTTFNQKSFDTLKQPMFFGETVNVARYDIQKHKIFESLIEKQLSFFWRPEEVDLANDRKDFIDLPEHEKHIFLSNLKYQTLLDSVQGRSPNVAFLPIVSLPELETWIETWSFSETIHSRSYTHIMRNVVPNPSEVFDDITRNDFITRRAVSVTKYYDELIEKCSYYTQLGEGSHTINGRTVDINLPDLKRTLYLTMVSVNVLEAIRFYVSFACSFAFAERAIVAAGSRGARLLTFHAAGSPSLREFYDFAAKLSVVERAAWCLPICLRVFETLPRAQRIGASNATACRVRRDPDVMVTRLKDEICPGQKARNQPPSQILFWSAPKFHRSFLVW